MCDSLLAVSIARAMKKDTFGRIPSNAPFHGPSLHRVAMYLNMQKVQPCSGCAFSGYPVKIYTLEEVTPRISDAQGKHIHVCYVVGGYRMRGMATVALVE